MRFGFRIDFEFLHDNSNGHRFSDYYSFDLIIISYSGDCIIATESMYLPREQFLSNKKGAPTIWWTSSKKVNID